MGGHTYECAVPLHGLGSQTQYSRAWKHLLCRPVMHLFLLPGCSCNVIAASSSCLRSRWNLSKPPLPSVRFVMYCVKIPQSLRLNFSSPFSASHSPFPFLLLFLCSSPPNTGLSLGTLSLTHLLTVWLLAPPLWVPVCWTSRQNFSSPSSESCWKLQFASPQVFF